MFHTMNLSQTATLQNKLLQFSALKFIKTVTYNKISQGITIASKTNATDQHMSLHVTILYITHSMRLGGSDKDYVQ